VQEVVDFEKDSIEEAPRIGTQLNTAFIAGMAKRENGFVILLNVDAVFSCAELCSFASAGDAATLGETGA
jgi:purine-binding chemotaxis protein CheW